MGLMPTWEREFVGIESATAPRNVIGFHPCQGGYFRPVADSWMNTYLCRWLMIIGSAFDSWRANAHTT